jgi:hypothetical protein
MSIKWNERTWYSWTLSIIFFLLVLPAWTYYLGTEYQKNTDLSNIKTEDFIPVSHEQKVSDIEYKIVKVKGFDVPQLVNLKDTVVMKKVNSKLMDIAQTFGCDNEVKSENDLFNVKTKVTYAKNDIFSVSIHTEYFCGGPYPTNDSNQSVTFSLKNGEEIPFKDLFTNYNKDNKALMSIIFAKQIKGTEIPECKNMYAIVNVGSKMDMNDYSKEIAYVVEDDGITAQPSFPHVAEACSEPAHVSISKIKEYINSSSILSWIK